MTLNEFKAWLDGLSDAMGDAPTPDQWAKIKAKLAEVQPFVIPNPPHPPIQTFDLPRPDQSGWRMPQPVTCVMRAS